MRNGAFASFVGNPYIYMCAGTSRYVGLLPFEKDPILSSFAENSAGLPPIFVIFPIWEYMSVYMSYVSYTNYRETIESFT